MLLFVFLLFWLFQKAEEWPLRSLTVIEVVVPDRNDDEEEEGERN